MSATSAIARDIMAHVHTFCTHHPESLFNALWPELSWGLVLRFRPTTTSTSFCEGLHAGKQRLRKLLRFFFILLFFIHLHVFANLDQIVNWSFIFFQQKPVPLFVKACKLENNISRLFLFWHGYNGCCAVLSPKSSNQFTVLTNSIPMHLLIYSLCFKVFPLKVSFV